MKQLLKIEEAAQLAVAIVGMYLLPFQFSWYVWVVLFLLPDISMMGYLSGPKAGAFTYNLFHHKASGVLLLLAGWYVSAPAIGLVGLILFAHSSFDRMMGYGLKYADSFHHTHLGMTGRQRGSREIGSLMDSAG